VDLEAFLLFWGIGPPKTTISVDLVTELPVISFGFFKISSLLTALCIYAGGLD